MYEIYYSLKRHSSRFLVFLVVEFLSSLGRLVDGDNVVVPAQFKLLLMACSEIILAVMHVAFPRLVPLRWGKLYPFTF